ncbi:cytochrome c [Belnapia sp. T18]|uniref:Cytochrome c n=1 Tax=Belnapia arida TaxID=2804533 RepID=A0ABS1UA18_9PROT|nr:cytochrome c [Belnapia arida]MBL6080126.1 cytochrome c [Belnapia arida]
MPDHRRTTACFPRLAILAGTLLALRAEAAEPGAGLARGERLYAAECASCHGRALEGQPRWWQADAAGQVPAPPLDGSGHAWQHPDAQLYEFIAHSMVSVAGPGYRSAMPAFAGRLAEDDIRAVIAFIKSRWPEGTRAAQTALNPGGEEALAVLFQQGGDWTFPPDCLDPAQRASRGPAR